MHVYVYGKVICNLNNKMKAKNLISGMTVASKKSHSLIPSLIVSAFLFFDSAIVSNETEKKTQKFTFKQS